MPKWKGLGDVWYTACTCLRGSNSFCADNSVLIQIAILSVWLAIGVLIESSHAFLSLSFWTRFSTACAGTHYWYSSSVLIAASLAADIKIWMHANVIKQMHFIMFMRNSCSMLKIPFNCSETAGGQAGTVGQRLPQRCWTQRRAQNNTEHSPFRLMVDVLVVFCCNMHEAIDTHNQRTWCHEQLSLGRGHVNSVFKTPPLQEGHHHNHQLW